MMHLDTVCITSPLKKQKMQATNRPWRKRRGIRDGGGRGRGRGEVNTNCERRREEERKRERGGGKIEKIERDSEEGKEAC